MKWEYQYLTTVYRTLKRFWDGEHPVMQMQPHIWMKFNKHKFLQMCADIDYVHDFGTNINTTYFNLYKEKVFPTEHHKYVGITRSKKWICRITKEYLEKNDYRWLCWTDNGFQYREFRNTLNEVIFDGWCKKEDGIIMDENNNIKTTSISLDDFWRYSYVISTSQEKYDHFCKVFTNAGISTMPKWFDAVKIADGNAGHSNKLNVSISHLFLIKYAKMMDFPFIVIFEDDAVPHRDIHRLLPYYLSEIPVDSVVVKLGWTKLAKGAPPAEKITDKWDKVKTRGAHSYIVFQKNYQKAIDILEQDNLIVDYSLFAYKLATHDNLFIQYNGENGHSTITGWFKGVDYLKRHNTNPNDYFILPEDMVVS